MEWLLVTVERRDRNAESGPDAVVVDAGRHHVDQHLVLTDRPGRHHFELERAFWRAVALLANHPSVHLLGHVAERRNLADVVKVFNGAAGLDGLSCVTVGHGFRSPVSGRSRQFPAQTVCDRRCCRATNLCRQCKIWPDYRAFWASMLFALQNAGASGGPAPGETGGLKCATSLGFSAPTRAIRRPANSNALYRKNLPRARPACRSHSICRPRPATTPTTCWRRAKSARSACRSAHLGDMRALFDGIPLAKMNTSMTINATAAWLMALYIAVADEQGAPRDALTGTIQNDIIKEYLSRGTYVFPPAPSMRLIKDIAIFTTSELPKWNPMNVCSYHLQEAGATPVQELAYALATAIAVLDTVKKSGEVDRGEVRRGGRPHLVLRQCRHALRHRDLQDARLRRAVGRDHARALRRHRSQAAAVPLRRAGQLARLTEPQPENNVARILIEMLAVTLSKNARARAVQLPAWNEALGLPRPWDQQWSLRMQQILAYETDLLEYGDLFDGSKVMDRQGRGAQARSARKNSSASRQMGGAIAAVESGYMKQRLVESNSARLRGDRARRADRGRRQQVPRNRALAADRRHRRRS